MGGFLSEKHPFCPIGYLTWMPFQLSRRIFLFFIWSRSPLRSLTKSKSVLHDSRKFIAS